MRLWPFGGSIERRDADFTDEYISYRLRQAGGVAGEISETAALEIAAGLYGRAFATADVMPSGVAADALDATVRETIGRELIRRGEVAFEIVVEGGAIRLQPLASWTVTGDPDPATWLYETHAAGASRTETRKRVSPERVLHVMYARSPSQPWKGVSPMRVAARTSALMANIEQRLSEETTAQSAYLLPVPDDASEDAKGELKGDLNSARGKVALAPTTRGGWGAGQDTRPQHDWKQMRVGADPPAVLDSLRTNTALHVLAACGVPVELIETGQGTASREAYRRFLHSSVVPLGELVAVELRRKLDEQGLSLSFERLFASDIQGRARAFQSMVGGGMDVAKAAALSGLLAPEED